MKKEEITMLDHYINNIVNCVAECGNLDTIELTFGEYYFYLESLEHEAPAEYWQFASKVQHSALLLIASTQFEHKTNDITRYKMMIDKIVVATNNFIDHNSQDLD